jgi:hypothetical protein
MSACQLIRQRADNCDITPASNWTQQQKTEQRTKKFLRGWHFLFCLLPIPLSEQESCRSGGYCPARSCFPIAKGYSRASCLIARLTPNEEASYRVYERVLERLNKALPLAKGDGGSEPTFLFGLCRLAPA